MKALKKIPLILLIASCSYTSAYAVDSSENEGVLIIGSFGFIALMIYDIATAPASAKEYNGRHMSALPLNMDRATASKTYNFGQPEFTRAALVKNYTQAIVYASIPSKKPKSPRTATLWSLGATVIPVTIGFALGRGNEFLSGSLPTASGAVLVTSGSIFGPSAGHIYAKKVGRGLLTSALRLGLAAVILGSIDWSEGD